MREMRFNLSQNLMFSTECIYWHIPRQKGIEDIMSRPVEELRDLCALKKFIYWAQLL